MTANRIDMLKLRGRVLRVDPQEIENVHSAMFRAVYEPERATPMSDVVMATLAMVADDDIVRGILNRIAESKNPAVVTESKRMDIPPEWEHTSQKFATWDEAHKNMDALTDDGWEIVSCGGVIGDGKPIYVTMKRRRRDRFEGVQF